MRRLVAPAPKAKVGYPRLRAAWGILAAPILLAPTLAGADASVPVPGQKGEPAPSKKPCPPATKGKYKAPRAPDPPPEAAPKPKKREEDLRIEGVYGQIRRPDAPSTGELTLFHPHDPGEPCFITPFGDEDDA
jgi:hypothetical protein